MTTDEAILLAVAILVLVPLIWIRLVADSLYSDATRRVWKSWSRTWRRLGGPNSKKNVKPQN